MNLASLEARRSDVLRVASAHGARNVRVFGSVARGEARPDSDLDLLVDLDPGRSLLDRAALMLDLEALFGCKVDVAVERGLRPAVRERLLAEAIPLWAPRHEGAASGTIAVNPSGCREARRAMSARSICQRTQDALPIG